MKRRCAIRGCSELGLTTQPQVASGLCSLPDEVALNCLAHVSRSDLVALAIASKSHHPLVVSRELWDLRWEIDNIEPSFYVYVIGGLINGKPTSDVLFYDCFEHKVGWIPPMKTARASASASLIDGKIYVFGGCGNEADSSNWAEVFDLNTRTWDSLVVNTPKMPLNIRHSVVLEEEEEETKIYAVDEDGQDFSFSPSKCMFSTSGKLVDSSKPGYTRDDWCVLGTVLFSRRTGGRILCCLPEDLD